MGTGRMISMTMADGKPVSVYHAEPCGVRRGGLVVVHEIFGITDHIKSICESYCTDGYEVMAPSLFDREQPGFSIGYGQEDMKAGIAMAYTRHPFELSVEDCKACIHKLKGDGLVFIVGYCYGGSVVWATACRCDELAAASSYYGKLAPEMADEVPKCPTICHFGSKDPSIPADAVEKLRTRRPEVQVHLYEAGHGFNSDRPSHHDEPAATLARDRTLELFRANGG